MQLEVDPASPVPPFEQIRSQLTALITSGALATGAQLPSIRQLAADLGLAANTVARAYRELEAGGLVVSRVRTGTTVAARKPLAAKEISLLLAEAAAGYVAAARRLGVSQDAAVAAVTCALTVASPRRRSSA